MNRRDRLILIIPAFWTSMFDIIVTITHQANEYWKGDLSKANEGNPIGAFFMTRHVSGIFAISIIWLILIVILGYHLPRKFSRVFLLFTLIAHSYGASTWLSNDYGFWYALSFILLNSIIFTLLETLLFKRLEQIGQVIKFRPVEI